MKERAILNIDKKTGIVVGTSIIKKATDDEISPDIRESMDPQKVNAIDILDIGITAEQLSFFDDTDTDTVTIFKDNYPGFYKLLATDSEEGQFCYDKKHGLRVRPYFMVSIVNKEDAIRLDKDKMPLLPVNIPIKLRVDYIDPENVGFLNQFHHLKIKDGYDFIDIGNPTPRLNKVTGSYTFTIQSAFPGICAIRVKDNKFLCKVCRFEMRFKQAIKR